VLGPRDLDARRAAVAGPLAPLARSLAADLAPLAAYAASVAPETLLPVEKARMTRLGGRCRVDATLLAFDPWSPRRHVCPACGREYDADEDYRWWIMWYQLWLAERAVHGAALALLAGDTAAGTLARRILDGCATRYLDYPNRDNVLGPTRPFFSTYLESIWLLQLCIALDLIEAARHPADRALGQRVRERVVEPSRALVASYDEGRSNRQVWNAAALAAAARVLGDMTGVERATLGRWGLTSHLQTGLLADGTWYEGENYHQFAHRGLWYGVTIAEHAGIALPSALVRRFDAGFVAPFLTALPDLTFPARRDSQWAVSLRQWRYAESCELGLARDADPRLGNALASLYDLDAPLPRRDTGRARSAAESERNEPATRLTRADLGWRSLLCAPPNVPNAERWAPASVHLEAQGLAVFRRDRGTLWAALDYGHGGGSHGHPDRLDLLLIDGGHRWLDDMGTGSYVHRSLHWYRSTLAHNAPLVDGRSQPPGDGRLVAYEEHDDLGWVRATASIAHGVIATRTVVVAADYVVDHLEWHADREVDVDLPMHADVALPDDLPRVAAEPGGGRGQEDGFDFLANVEATSADAGRVVALSVERVPVAWVSSTARTTWFRATAPGAPGKGDARFVFLRARGRAGQTTSVWSTRGAVADVAIAGDGARLTMRGATVHEHAWTADGWQVTEHGEHGSRARVLRGRVRASSHAVPPAAPPSPRAPVRVGESPLRLRLAEPHYRRSEESWAEAGEPRGVVTLRDAGGTLHVTISVVTPHPSFVPAGTENPLDNERAETNGDGVQLYVEPRVGEGHVLGWLLVPDADAPGDVRVVALTPPAHDASPAARWTRTPDGYELSIDLAPLGRVLGEAPFGFDVIVNETVPGRERRRGQLVLSGARGEFVYLQGDRHDPSRFLVLRLGS